MQAHFAAVCARLKMLSSSGLITQVSHDAYRAGLTELFPPGPVAYLPGSRRLAGVRLRELAVHPTCARLPLRWEATGPAGARFAVLDADLTLTADGETASVLALTGSYRLAPDPADTMLDPQAEQRCAARTFHSFLSQLRCAIDHPAGRVQLRILAS